MADDATLALASPQAPGAVSARRLNLQFALQYCLATTVAVATTLVLSLIGLEFSAHQWWAILAMVPAAAASFITPDLFLIRHQLRPLRIALDQLDAGAELGVADARAALVRALNLPFYAIVRVTLLHGPLAGFSGWWAMELANRWFDAGFAGWQITIFASLIFFFASPGHAIVEFFALSRRLVPVIDRIYPWCEGSYAGVAEKPVAIRLQSKLLYLCFFITALPLGFVAFSIIFKLDVILRNMGVTPSPEAMRPLWFWIYSVLTVCLFGALSMSYLTANEVSRSAAKLLGGMNEVERGNLSTHLKITGTDEYADLYRGFNLMIGGLQDEVRLLEVSQDLAGELKLDVLIGRILSAATDLLEADRSTLFVHDAESHELWSLLADGLKVKEIRFPDTAGIAGTVLSTGRAENIADAYEDPRFNQDIDRKTGYRTRSILCMPIVSKTGKRIGVTQVLNKKNGVFTPKDEQRLRAFTAQIAVTLENAKLFDEVLAIKNYNENILASTTNGVITLNQKRYVVTANAAALKILGIDNKTLSEQPFTQLFNEGNHWLTKAVERVAESGEPEAVVDADLLRHDGNRASVNLNCTPLNDAQGLSIGLVLSFEDFTSEKRVKSTMARYMSQEVADQLLAGGESVLGGKLQKVSVLFSDVRGFTAVSEALGARETVSMLNEYFEQMVEAIFQHKGILDKYIGDAIMALFGAPFEAADDADRAVATANGMLLALDHLNVARAVKGYAPLEIGIGIATGDVIVGNIGSTRRMEYTVIGDGVNLASRLEGATKHYGVRVLISESTVAALTTPILMREIDRLRVKGKDRAVTVFEVLGHSDTHTLPATAQCLQSWDNALSAYRARRFEAAEAAFHEVLSHHATDKPAQLYIGRCRHYAENPPPADWDTVWRLAEK